ncbi:MAG: DUF3501 family protein [Pseudomonadales bacterium]|nr:DUF3501 family protein [Pseudomonadales bacterium]
MRKLDKASLWSLEQYAEQRPAFRAEVIEHKKPRRVPVGAHATFYFEDFLTMKYQVQEMLRVERIFDAKEILAELEAYNPLIPDGRNLKATFMIEYPDPEERRVALGRLGGIEDTLWLQAEGQPRIPAIANEDMERSREDKASAVHFLRFELDDGTIAAFKAGGRVQLGIDHPQLKESVTLTPDQLQALAADLD